MLTEQFEKHYIDSFYYWFAMQLKNIDKTRYRNHLNKVIVACIAVLITGSLGIAQFLIALFPSADGTHFHWNLLGVIVTSVAIGFTLNKYKNHEFMTEVTYVWELKKQLNRITRKMRQLQDAVANNDVVAMQILNYSYAGSRQLWQLDDNMVVSEELSLWQAELDARARELNVVLDPQKFDPDMLANY